MAVLRLDATRVIGAKRAFSTRRVKPDRMQTLITGDVQPRAGDLVLARVDQIGKQTKLELTDGRRAHMFPGDEIIVTYGNRYAPDQYEAVIGSDLSPCDLVAAGGIAGIELSRHQRMLPPTSITPLGLIGGEDGTRLNLMQFAIEAADHLPEIPAILSLGTAMNAGKTLTATSLVRGLKRLGFSVAALKITGTGAGGDMWIVRDAGADIALDFTDAGFGTTYLTPVPEIEQATYRLMNYAAAHGCEVAVIEVADGLQQLETAQLIRSEAIHRIALGVVFAAYDAMGAKCGVDILREAGHAVLAMSGRLGRSPLAVREAEAATGLRVYSPFELQEGALVPAIRERAAELHALSGFRAHGLGRIAQGAPAAGRMLLDVNGPAIRPMNGGAAGRPAANGQIISFLPRPHQDRAIEILGLVAEAVMRAEVVQLCNASLGQHPEQRMVRRNGFRDGTWITAFGTVPLRIPRLRQGYYRPSFLDRGRDDAALVNEVEAVMTAMDDTSLEIALAALSGGMGTVLAPRDMAMLITRIRERRAMWQAGDYSAHPVAARDIADPQGAWFPASAEQDDHADMPPSAFALASKPLLQSERETEEDEDGFAPAPGTMFQPPRVVAGE